MPFVVEQKTIQSEVKEQLATPADNSAASIMILLLLVYLFRNIIFTAFKFGLFAVLGLVLYNFIR